MDEKSETLIRFFVDKKDLGYCHHRPVVMPLIIPSSVIAAAVAATSSNRSVSAELETVQSTRSTMTRAEMLREAQEHKAEIMTIMPNIQSINGWNVIDSRPDQSLYLLGPEEEHMEEYGFLIGTVIDLKNRIILSGSSGFNHTSVTDKIETSINGDVHLTDVFGNDHHLKKGRFEIKPFFEGIRVRVFYHNGKMYVSNDKKINVDKSKVSNSITFLEMYESLGGPPVEELFNITKKYSPWVYHFTISTPETRWVNKIPNSPGVLIFDGPSITYSNQNTPYDIEDIDFDIWDFSEKLITDFSEIIPETSDKKIYSLHPIELSVANSFLYNGFNPTINSPENKPDDTRLGPGEAVIITVSPEGKNPYQIQVWSPAYEWRFGIVNENSHLPHQFYVLANMIHIDTNSTEGLEDFKSKMPLFPQYEIDQLVEHIEQTGPLLSWPNELKARTEAVSTKEGRLYNVWASLLMSVPFDQQKVIAPLVKEFSVKRDEVTEWIQMIEEEYEVVDAVKVGPRARMIINDVRRLAETGTKPGLSKEDQVKSNIKYFIDNEYTDSLYRLIRNMKNWDRLQMKNDT